MFNVLESDCACSLINTTISRINREIFECIVHLQLATQKLIELDHRKISLARLLTDATYTAKPRKPSMDEVINTLCF
jgi:hypothetical protein